MGQARGSPDSVINALGEATTPKTGKDPAAASRAATTASRRRSAPSELYSPPTATPMGQQLSFASPTARAASPGVVSTRMAPQPRSKGRAGRGLQTTVPTPSLEHSAAWFPGAPESKWTAVSSSSSIPPRQSAWHERWERARVKLLPAPLRRWRSADSTTSAGVQPQAPAWARSASAPPPVTLTAV